MCGIVGAIYPNQQAVRADVIEGMASALQHRGPDLQLSGTLPGAGSARSHILIAKRYGSYRACVRRME